MGWNFRHAHFHEEGRRTLYKAYGIKFVIIVQGRAGGMDLTINKDTFDLFHFVLLNFAFLNKLSGKFDLKNTVINIVAGLGLLSFITMFCDFILLNYVSERKIVRSNFAMLKFWCCAKSHLTFHSYISFLHSLGFIVAFLHFIVSGEAKEVWGDRPTSGQSSGFFHITYLCMTQTQTKLCST